MLSIEWLLADTTQIQTWPEIVRREKGAGTSSPLASCAQWTLASATYRSVNQGACHGFLMRWGLWRADKQTSIERRLKQA